MYRYGEFATTILWLKETIRYPIIQEVFARTSSSLSFGINKPIFRMIFNTWYKHVLIFDSYMNRTRAHEYSIELKNTLVYKAIFEFELMGCSRLVGAIYAKDTDTENRLRS